MRNHLFDGDFMLVTDTREFVDCAFDYFINTNVPVNETPKLGSAAYDFSSSSIARLDNIIADNQEIIGLSSNCAANALSNWWTTGDSKMWEIAIIQAINAQNAIDSAKRLFDVNIGKENKRLCAMVDNCSWFASIKNKKEKFESSCAMDVLSKSSYIIPNQYRELSMMDKLIDIENNYNIAEHYDLNELHSLIRQFLGDRLRRKKEKDFDIKIIESDIYEITLEIKHFKLRHGYEYASLMREMYTNHKEVGFIDIINWIKASGINPSVMFTKEYESKKCIFCGAEFKAKQKRQIICGCHECKKQYMRLRKRGEL